MNKLELEKNRLDLAYKRNLQLLNVILIIGAGSFVAYFAGLILNPEKIYQHSVILFVIGILTYILYLKINDVLKEVSNKIKKTL